MKIFVADAAGRGRDKVWRLLPHLLWNSGGDIGIYGILRGDMRVPMSPVHGK